jgi:hypothetical protein
MLKLSRSRILALGTAAVLLALAALLHQGVLPGGAGKSFWGLSMPAKNAETTSNMPDDACDSVKPILDRLVDVFNLSGETLIADAPIPEIAAIDGVMERLLEVVREEGQKVPEGLRLGEEILTREGYKIFYLTRAGAAVLSSDKHSMMWIDQQAMRFQDNKSTQNVTVTCYRDDIYRVYIVEHASETYDNAYAHITVIKNSQVLCACRYKYILVFPPGPPGVDQLRKATQPDYILRGTIEGE